MSQRSGSCDNYYKRYKKTCDKSLYSNLKCSTGGIHKMGVAELLHTLQLIQRLHTESSECHAFRVLFRNKCVSTSKRNQSHNYVIQKAKNYSNICEKRMEAIHKRLRELQEIAKQEALLLNQSEKLFQILGFRKPRSSAPKST